MPQIYAFGEAFESWVILEIIKNISYNRLDWDCSYTRTKDDVEIDLVITRPGLLSVFIEIKSKDRVTESDAKSLLTLSMDLDPNFEKWVLSNDRLERKF